MESFKIILKIVLPVYFIGFLGFILLFFYYTSEQYWDDDFPDDIAREIQEMEIHPEDILTVQDNRGDVPLREGESNFKMYLLLDEKNSRKLENILSAREFSFFKKEKQDIPSRIRKKIKDTVISREDVGGAIFYTERHGGKAAHGFIWKYKTNKDDMYYVILEYKLSI